MTIILRPYQTNAVAGLRKSMAAGHRHLILESATGSGKTIMAGEIVRLSALNNKRILLITHRDLIFRSTLKHLSNVNITVEEISPNKKFVYSDAMVYLAMVETLARRINKITLPKFDLVVIDECHFQTFNKIIERFTTPVQIPDKKGQVSIDSPYSYFGSGNDPYILGLSGTPAGKHISRFYTDIVHTISITELIAQKALVPCKAWQMKDDFSDLQKDKTGEFTEESQWKHYNKSKLFDGVIAQYKEKINGKRTIVFNVNVAHCMQMHEQFMAAGIQSAIITGDTSTADREKIRHGFLNRYIQVVQSVGVMTVGVDWPETEAVILNRAIGVLSLFLQCCGRASRPFTDEGKEMFFVLCFGGNFDRHGLWDEERSWQLSPPKKKKRDGVAPVKECTSCSAIVGLMVSVCPYCGHVFPSNKKDKELREGQMIEVAPKVPSQIVGKKIGDCTLEELYELQNSKKYKPNFCWRVVRSKGADAIKEYAQISGYEKGWIKRQIESMDDTQFTNFVLR